MDMPTRRLVRRSVPRSSDHEPRKIGLNAHSEPTDPHTNPRHDTNSDCHAYAEADAEAAANSDAEADPARSDRKADQQALSLTVRHRRGEPAFPPGAA